MINFIKVGAREDASAVLEEIRRWWPGNCHCFWVGDVNFAVEKRGGGETEREWESNEEQELRVEKRAEGLLGPLYLGRLQKGRASRSAPGKTVPRPWHPWAL